jgi:hypothetical protein
VKPIAGLPARKIGKNLESPHLTVENKPAAFWFFKEIDRSRPIMK